MADATVVWQGASTDPASFSTLPTPGQGIGIMFRANNATSVDTSNPIVIPAAGTEYSYEKLCRINITANGDSNTIDNLKFYISDPASGSMGTGVTQYMGFSATNPTPVDTNSSIATVAVPTTASMTTWTGVTATTGTGVIGHYVYFQIDVGTTAAHGSQTSQTYTCRYDEV